MAGIITMQKMRYINSLNRVSSVRTSRCFVYNNVIIFAVPKMLMSKAIGAGARNIRMLQEIFGKRVKIILEPRGKEDAEKFVRDIVSPVQFKSLEEKEDEFILNAGSQSKAALIGRNKRRLIELSQIMVDSFGKGLKII